MWKALILFSLQLLSKCHVVGANTYECGDHGRFEYCIDEIPGCVIGCHCHPGYYFDTDTKICEPNSKLIEHNRRNNAVELTRVQKNYVTPNTIYDTELASSTNKIDGQIDEITKDANDLGDWLYNQFFKTIENQVINNTNNEDALTRRSGSKQPIGKAKRKKKWHKGSKSSKQREKKEHLRRKLLRITENDSLFDLSSKSSSDSSDSSSSESEFETNEYHHNHDDDEHGHKKIVMINKKPKQPLPSFIFLPNLDTPFYPPIGLPPPPIVPMYPVVPVPPMPMFPIPGYHENVDHKVATATSVTATLITTSSTSPEATTITSVPPSAPQTSTVTITTIKATQVPNSEGKSLRLKNKKKKKTKFLNNDGSDQRTNSLKAIDRQKILERLKEKMSNPAAKLFIPSWKRNKKIFANTFVNQNVDAESPFLDNGLADDMYLSNEIQSKPLEEESAFPDNVDFKYITELIHRVDLNNKSNDLPPIEYHPLDSIEVYRPSKIHKNQFSDYSVPFDTPDGRRYNRPNNHQPDESYYTNLGRQIAGMIRGTHSQNRQKNYQSEERPNKRKNDLYFNNNSPTSFWERSVRSPLTFLKANNKKFEYLKRSNELLFDIENKVEIIASTAPALSLLEIENIVNVMEAAKREIQSKDKHIRTSGSPNNLNIDLWPQKSHNTRNEFQNPVPSLLNIGRQDKSTGNFKTSNKEIVKSINDLPGVRMHSIQNFLAWNGQSLNENTKLMNHSKVQTTVKPSNKNNYFEINPNNYLFTRPKNVFPARTNPFSQNTIKQSFLNQQMNPLFLSHRKYFQDKNNNYFINKNNEVSRLPSTKRGVQPSYFRNEMNHLDFMD